MAFVTPFQASFNGGEISPRLYQRIDQSVRQVAVKTMDGWLPMLQGPAEACPGTVFVAMAKGDCIILPFVFNQTQEYVVELGDYYARFYTNDAQILSGGEPYEIETPWTLAQAENLCIWQSFDVLYCAHGEVPLQRLYRTSADSFAIDAVALDNGPLEPRNSDKTIFITPANVTGFGIAITSTHPIFEPGDVGGLLQLESGGFSLIPQWEAGMETTASMLVQNQGRVYQKAGGQLRTGTIAPEHTEGTRYDGMGQKDINDKGPYGVAWTYLNNQYGLLKITSYVSSTEVTADVLTRLPSTDATWRWRFGMFSDRRGYAEQVCVWQERLVLTRGISVAGSVAGALTDFSLFNEFGDVSRDQSFLFNMDDTNPVAWLVPDETLIIGTTAAEYELSAASAAEGIGPGNLKKRATENEGSAPYRPVKIGGRIVHVQSARARLIQLAYDPSRLFKAESPNLSRNADHIGRIGFNELAWCKEPERLLWTRRDDGTLAVCAYDPTEDLLAWATRTLGGGMVAKRICKITDPDGRYGQLWICAQRDDDYLILRMPPVRSTDDRDEQIMVDAATRYQGAAVTIANAPHLAGREVDILADGRPIMGVTLDETGSYPLGFSAGDIITGYRVPNALTFMVPATGSENGPALGKAKRANRIDLFVINSDTLSVECQGDVRTINLLRQSTAFDQRLPLNTGRERVEPRGNADADMEITVRRQYPRPSTLSGIMAFYAVAQS